MSIAEDGIGVQQHVSAKTKLQMAIVEEGVCSIQQAVEKKMAFRMMEALVREKQGIKPGARVLYSASEEDKKIDFRVTKFGSHLSG